MIRSSSPIEAALRRRALDAVDSNVGEFVVQPSQVLILLDRIEHLRALCADQ